jgi:hypothetical protein
MRHPGASRIKTSSRKIARDVATGEDLHSEHTAFKVLMDDNDYRSYIPAIREYNQKT